MNVFLISLYDCVLFLIRNPIFVLLINWDSRISNEIFATKTYNFLPLGSLDSARIVLKGRYRLLLNTLRDQESWSVYFFKTVHLLKWLVETSLISIDFLASHGDTFRCLSDRRKKFTSLGTL